MIESRPTIGQVRCIAIEGADARRFAQSQFSGNVDALVPGRWQWNAWLTPQGRVRALMHLVDTGEGNLLAVLRGGDAQEICAALSRYRLRLSVTLEVREFAGRADAPAALAAAAIDEPEILLGYGSRSLRLGMAPDIPVDESARSAWRLADIREGWPSLPVGGPEFLPPALGLEHLQAVSFDKGCYPGQEIAARLRYRGGHKHRLYHLECAAPPSKGPLTFPEDITCLDAVIRDETADAIVVAPEDLPRESTAAGWTLRVISRFDS